ncbi:MAG: M23 family metallopeptidase [Gemmatimonadota bacterium]
MPRRRGWTILVVPHGNTTPRSFELSERGLRALVGAAVGGVLAVITALVVLFSPLGTPGAWRVARENARLKADLATIDARLQVVLDTISSIERQDLRIRMLAGIEPDSAGEMAARELATGVAAGDDGKALPGTRNKPQRFASKPFLGRLGFGGARPDLDGMIRRVTELSASFRAVSDTLQRNVERMANTPSIMPTSGWLTGQFSRSRFHPILHTSRAHEGIDVVAPMGAPIVAPAAGRVISSGRERSYGLSVEIDHGNGIVTRYAHASRLMVTVGQRVTRGQVIAAVGNSGLSTGPHLHYEIHLRGKPVDPLTFVMPAGKITD